MCAPWLPRQGRALTMAGFSLSRAPLLCAVRLQRCSLRKSCYCLPAFSKGPLAWPQSVAPAVTPVQLLTPGPPEPLVLAARPKSRFSAPQQLPPASCQGLTDPHPVIAAAASWCDDPKAAAAAAPQACTVRRTLLRLKRPGDGWLLGSRISFAKVGQGQGGFKPQRARGAGRRCSMPNARRVCGGGRQGPSPMRRDAVCGAGARQ